MAMRYGGTGFTLVEVPTKVAAPMTPLLGPPTAPDEPQWGPVEPTATPPPPEEGTYLRDADGSIKTWVWIALGTVGVGAAYWVWKG
jgi:hypothetical protein